MSQNLVFGCIFDLFSVDTSSSLALRLLTGRRRRADGYSLVEQPVEYESL
jgi:hypothetical protein